MAGSAQARSAAPHLRCEPVRQRGAYALVRDGGGRLLLVRGQNGRCYLPGGRIESGEDARAALAREIQEECGWSAVAEAPLGKAQQSIMAGSVDLDATYWRARLIASHGRSGEHELLWVAPATAVDLLHRTGDRAIVAAVLTDTLESVA